MTSPASRKRKRAENNNNSRPGSKQGKSENAETVTKAAAANKPRSILKRANSVKKNRPISFSNKNGGPLAFAAPNSAPVPHDPERITKPSTAGKGRYKNNQLEAFFSTPEMQFQQSRIAWLNYVLAFIMNDSTTYREMYDKIIGISPTIVSPFEKQILLSKLSRSYSSSNNL